MRKKAQALVMALVMLLTTVAIPLMGTVSVDAAENQLSIKFHYLREDGNYEGWDAFTWGGTVADSNAFTETDDNGAAVAEAVVKPGSTEIGFIIRQGGDSWAGKDWDGDRFVNVEGYCAGTIHVYITSGVEAVETDYTEAVEGEYTQPEAEGVKISFVIDQKKTDDNWGLWLWDDIGTDAIYPLFEENEAGQLEITYEVAAGAGWVGFIVRDDNWSKDWEGDRTVDVDGYVSGTIKVYITSGQEAFEVDYSEAKKEPLKLNFYIDQKKTEDNWGLWLWDDIGTEAIYPLFEANEDGQLKITYEVAAGATWVGFIVRDDNWQKDPDGDRQVDVSNYVGGSVDIYLTSGSAEFEIDDTLADTGAKLKSAVYESNTVVATTSMAIAEEDLADAFIVMCEGEKVAIKSVVAGEAENTYIISFEKALDRTKAYVVVFSGNEYEVKMPSLYKDPEWVAENTYTGKDLGATWTKAATTFKVWAPLASEVSVNLYSEGEGDNKLETIAMTKAEQGVWAVTVESDLNGVYYTYTVNNSGNISEACDPYAVTTGINGNRAMVIDLDSTDPEGWENDKNPNAGKNFTDAVIYELHVRDASIDESSGVSDANKGNFLGLTEHGPNTILDHMVDLGITHLHLLPVYDINSVDEKTDGFNWGYDPKNYNVPEGSYSSDPYNGEVRVAEMKEMVQTLHENGISVVMDVVYNHVADAANFSFNQIVPQYFSRINENGGYSSNSGCGNDTASEHVMVRKYIVESIKYWADEYHIDGFRFDLVGLIDTITINELMKEVWADHPDVVFYGEGWEMNSYDTGVSMTIQNNADIVPGFAFFNDTFRDTIKGSVFDYGTGYVSGAAGLEEKIEQCFAGAAVWGSAQTVCPTPLQTINYNSCHDNNTLYDRLKISCPDATEEEIIAMNNLAAAINLTSQGVPFIHAAEDFLRSKPLPDGGYDHNSYSSGDAINSIKWDTLADNIDTYEYYKGLIEFRKAHAALRMTDAAEVAANITAMEGLDANVTAFNINAANGETADALFVIFNPNPEATTVALPEGEWNIYVNGEKAGTEVLGTANGSVTVEGISAMVLVDEADAADEPGTPDKPVNPDEPVNPETPTVPEKGEEITKEDIETAEGNKKNEIVKEDNKEYVILGNVAMKDLTIKAEKGIIAEDAYFVRKYLESGELYTKAETAIANKLKDVVEFKAVEIDLYAGDGTAVTELDDYVYVTIPVPTDLAVEEGNILVVYRINDDGSMTNCEATEEDGQLTFRTNHFSTFVIAIQAEASVVPETGDNANFALWIAMLGLGVVAMTSSVVMKRRAN